MGVSPRSCIFIFPSWEERLLPHSPLGIGREFYFVWGLSTSELKCAPWRIVVIWREECGN